MEYMSDSANLNMHADRLYGARECRHLVSRYAYYFSALRTVELAGLWAKRDDSIYITTWGEYNGYKSIRRHFVEEIGDRDDSDMKEFMKGKAFIRDFNTEMLQVAGDGNTARGSWISMGHDAYVRPDGIAQADWVWNKYAIEFIKTEEGWKIWKMHIFPVFSTPFEQAWSEDPGYLGFRFPDLRPDKPLAKPLWHWTVDGAYPYDEPNLPRPYETYEDIAFILRERQIKKREGGSVHGKNKQGKDCI